MKRQVLRRATKGTLDLRPLFNPKSIVVVGASRDATRAAGRPVSFLQDWGYLGPIAIVHPSASTIADVACFRSIGAVPWVPELAVICLEAPKVLSALRECASKGIRAAIVFAAGFSERAEGGYDERRIGDLAAATGLLVCGPNSLGVINASARLPGTFSSVLADKDLLPGDIGFVTQSGALGIYLYAEASARGLGMSYWASTGNEASLGFGQYLAWIARQRSTTVICAYIEGVKRGDEFRQSLATASHYGKPVIVLKGGKSMRGASAALSHTAAMAGDSATYSGVLRQEEAIEVDDTGELLDVASILRAQPRLDPTKGVAIASSSGGGSILLADWLTKFGIRIADLKPETESRIAQLIPKFGSATNPVDFTGNLMNDIAMVGRTLIALADDDGVTAVVLFIGLGGQAGEDVVDSLAELKLPGHCLLLIVWIGISESKAARFGHSRIPVFSSPGDCARALAHVWKWRTSTTKRSSNLTPSVTRPRTIMDAPRVVGEVPTKVILARCGLPTPRSWLAIADRALPVPGLAKGVVYAVKGQAAGVAHKAANGLVRLSVTADRVETAINEIRQIAARANLKLTGVLVEEMAMAGLELLVTLRRDQAFGWLVIVGRGGAAAETYGDIAVRACPLEPREALATLQDLRFYPMIVDSVKSRQGLRPLTEFLSRLSRLPEELAKEFRPSQLDELEMNPIVVSAKGVLIVDALAVLARADERLVSGSPRNF